MNRKEDLPSDYIVRIAAGSVVVTYRDHERCLSFTLCLTSQEAIPAALERALADQNTPWVPYSSFEGKKKRERKQAKENG